MLFVILDLEWNTAFSRQKKCYVNEIIEFGAVKLDEDLNLVDTYSSFVRPQIERKLHSRVKKLTHISNEDIEQAEDYKTVTEQFVNWIQKGGYSLEDAVILSWGDMDVRALIDNDRYFFHDPIIPFLHQYCDLQAAFMKEKGLPMNQQIGLSAAADLIEINPDDYVHHRALGDCELTVECFRNIYQKGEFEKKYIKECNEQFYKRLLFKPYIIKDIHDKQIDPSCLNCTCIECGNSARRISEWHFNNSSFRANFICDQCNERYRVNVQFRRLYSQLNVKKSIVSLDKE